ncbi:DUF2690 domain-containing protein [Streptosporangium sp. NPDC003464]
MKIRVVTATVAAAGLALFAASPADAHTYDHKDPYREGCARSAKVVRTAAVKTPARETVGTVRLMWSRSCKTNWTEVSTSSTASGTISVYTDRGSDTFRFKAGNGGRHWGDMMYAPRICAWGSVRVRWNGGRGGQNGQGTTGKACG